MTGGCDVQLTTGGLAGRHWRGLAGPGTPVQVPASLSFSTRSTVVGGLTRVAGTRALSTLLGGRGVGKYRSPGGSGQRRVAYICPHTFHHQTGPGQNHGSGLMGVISK